MSDTTKDGQPGRPLPKGEAKATKTLIAIQKLIATQRLALNDVAVSDLSAGILDSFRTQANALRDAVVSSTPSPGHQKLYDETLSITNNWVNDLEGAANRKRPRSTPSPEKAVKHRKISGGPHGAIMQPTMTEDPAVIEGPLTAEDPTITSPAFPPAKGDARAEFSALLAMDAEEQALPSRRAVADVWNIQAIEEMTSRYLQENPAIQEQARRYLANSYHARTLHHLRIASQLLNDSS